MTASTIQPTQAMPLAHPTDYTQEQINLIKATLAPETDDMEFALFMEVARVQGLSPLQKQIHAVMRWDAQAKRKKMVIQTGIDGYRLIAARTGQHIGTTDATFGPLTKDGFPAWAQVTVKKLVHGHIAEYPATAFWEEYVQTVKDKNTGEVKPNSMWGSRPKGQLSKCAEALALRKAFPAELSGVYTDTEMEQADSGTQEARPAQVQQEVKSDASPDEEKLQAWASRIGDMAARIRAKWPDADVGYLIDGHRDYRSNLDEAKALYVALKELGETLAAPPVSDSDTVDAEFTPEPEVPAFDPKPAKPADTDPIGPERAHRLHRYLGAILKGSEYEGKHDLFVGEALGREVSHLQDILVGEARLVNDYATEFQAARQVPA